MDVDVERRIVLASRAFEALHVRKAVCLDKNLRVETKMKICQACVLSVLLYGSECWISLCEETEVIPPQMNPRHHQ